MSKSMKDRIINFLQGESAIKKINFNFNGIGIWPGAYERVVDALKNDYIQVIITNSIEKGGSAAYSPEIDTLKLRPNFDINEFGQRGAVIHETTHAYLDCISSGPINVITAEACSYLAQATYYELNDIDIADKGNVFDIITKAISIAKNTVINGKYKVSDSDVNSLEGIIKSNSLYSGKASDIYMSNGFTRNVGANIGRFITKIGGTKK